MVINVGVNGLGVMGRHLIRAIKKQEKDGTLSKGEIEVVAFNDLFPAEQLAPLLKFDSVYGHFDGVVFSDGKDIRIDGKIIDGSLERDVTKLNWEKRGVDIVYESTGYFAKKPGVEGHLKAGAKKVLISAPSNFAEKTFIMGVNSDKYNDEKIISNASCTTNCLAPLSLALYKEIGPFSGLMTTIHAYTNDQRLVDTPHEDLARAYAAALNLIPTTTGAAKAIGEVMPELDKKMNGLAIRAPVPSVSLVDLVVQFKKEVTKEEINEAVKRAAGSYLDGILNYCDGTIVSNMILGNQYSSIFDSKQTMVVGNLAKVLSWYDNVVGYSHRTVDLIKLIGKK
jgi:glyceraldehyde 3-phosphate dehydrogenase